MSQSQSNISSLSEISSASLNAVVIPKDNENLEEIFRHLCNEIRSIANEIQKEIKQCVSNIALNSEKTVVLHDMVTLLENKTNIINKLTTLIKESKLTDFPHFKEEAIFSIDEMMKDERLSCEKAVELLERIKQENETYLKCLKESEQFFNEVEEANEITVDSNLSEESIINTTNAINKDLKDCKKDVKKLLNDVFPNFNWMDILGDLFETSSVEEQDKWYKIKDPEDIPVVNFLVEWGLVIRNPDDHLRVKLLL